ncbi:MAG: ribosome recycling factor [Bacilli bacterium]|nr:ribosome recycling factor [Bacilli bacterium]MDD4077218.1 ribosome recycling factor [Bacilli bacterium]
MPQNFIDLGEEKMIKTISVLEKDLGLVRTGRANPSILNNVSIAYYGVNTPLNQIASISVPEAQTLMIKPYDRTILKDIEKAIQIADLNLVPINDGTVIRINFPPLTEQRRKDLVKEVRAMAENYKIVIRNIRREMMDQIKKMEKDSQITEDDLKKESDNIQKLTDKFTDKIDGIIKEKEKAIMEI